MKLVIVTFVVAAISSLGATVLVPDQGAPQKAGEPGRVLFKHDVSLYAVERGPLDGAPGASAVGFRVSNDIQGTALIVGLDQPVLAVFVGLNTPDKHLDAPFKDLQVVFTLTDGSQRPMKPAAGGGAGLLFKSPEGVPMTDLREVALCVDKAAKWAK